MKSVIFANGVLVDKGSVTRLFEPSDLIVAADGGGRHCLTLGLTPHVVIGDMDSLSPEVLKAFQAAGSEIVRHPAQKDYTDLELAIKLSLDRGADEIVILGALGERWDMTVANVMILASETWDIPIRLIDGDHEIRCIRGGDRVRLQGRKGDILSLIPVGRKAEGITLSGLEYPLVDETLNLGATRGVSNVFVGSTATVRLDRGLLLCVLLHLSPDVPA